MSGFAPGDRVRIGADPMRVALVVVDQATLRFPPPEGCLWVQPEDGGTIKAMPTRKLVPLDGEVTP